MSAESYNSRAPKQKLCNGGGGGAVPRADRPFVPLRAARARFEMEYIAETLREYAGNLTRTARALGLSRGMLRRKLKRYGLR